MGFGVADSYLSLTAARLAQGLAGVACWTGALTWLMEAAPAGRRGAVLGIAMGFTVAGGFAGPTVGGAASDLGRTWVFVALASVAAAIATAAVALRPPARRGRQRVGELARAVRTLPVLRAAWLLFLPSMLLGMLVTLAPLQLDRAGVGSTMIAVTFATAAGVEAVVHPVVGRWSDRRGRLMPIRIGLLVAAVVGVTLPWLGSRWLISVFVVVGGISCAFLITPAMTLLSESWESAGLSHAMGVALLNAAFAPGFAAGPALGGAVAQAAGDAAAWGLFAAFALGTVPLLLGRRTSLSAAARPA